MPLAPRSSWLKKMWQELEGFLSSSKSWGQHLSKLSLTAGRIIWSSHPSVCSLILQVRKLNPRGIVTCPKPCIQQYIKQFHELIHFPLYSLVSSNVSPRHFVFNSLLLCSQIVAAPNISNGEILVHNLLFSVFSVAYFLFYFFWKPQPQPPLSTQTRKYMFHIYHCWFLCLYFQAS